MDEYYRAIRLLPSWLAGPLGQLPAQTAAQIHELRFRTGCGVFVTLAGRQLPLQDLPECPLQLRECVLDQFQIEEIFHTLCGGAVHAHQTELAHGFLTTPSGCRVGVAGRYVDRDGQTVLQQVQGLNLRIARAVPIQLPDELLVQLKKHFIGMLLVGEPDSGKTTLLRQIARELAGMQRRACVVDERCEIFPPGDSEKMPPLDLLSGIPKERAVQMALRTLSPQVIFAGRAGHACRNCSAGTGLLQRGGLCCKRPCRKRGRSRPAAAGAGAAAAWNAACICTATRLHSAGKSPAGLHGMMQLFHWAAAALLLLCGWLTGSAFQVRTEQHILQLQRTVELLQRIRQEIAYRRLDLEQLQRCLVQEKLLESDAAQKLQEIPAPERFDDAERLCFEQCFAGLGQSEAAQECERLDYYSARFEAFLHQAQQKAASGQGLPCRLGLAAGAVAALILL